MEPLRFPSPARPGTKLVDVGAPSLAAGAPSLGEGAPSLAAALPTAAAGAGAAGGRGGGEQAHWGRGRGSKSGATFHHLCCPPRPR